MIEKLDSDKPLFALNEQRPGGYPKEIPHATECKCLDCQHAHYHTRVLSGFSRRKAEEKGGTTESKPPGPTKYHLCLEELCTHHIHFHSRRQLGEIGRAAKNVEPVYQNPKDITNVLPTIVETSEDTDASDTSDTETRDENKQGCATSSRQATPPVETKTISDWSECDYKHAAALARLCPDHSCMRSHYHKGKRQTNQQRRARDRKNKRDGTVGKKMECKFKTIAECGILEHYHVKTGLNHALTHPLVDAEEQKLRWDEMNLLINKNHMSANTILSTKYKTSVMESDSETKTISDRSGCDYKHAAALAGLADLCQEEVKTHADPQVIHTTPSEAKNKPPPPPETSEMESDSDDDSVGYKTQPSGSESDSSPETSSDDEDESDCSSIETSDYESDDSCESSGDESEDESKGDKASLKRHQCRYSSENSEVKNTVLQPYLYKTNLKLERAKVAVEVIEKIAEGVNAILPREEEPHAHAGSILGQFIKERPHLNPNAEAKNFDVFSRVTVRVYQYFPEKPEEFAFWERALQILSGNFITQLCVTHEQELLVNDGYLGSTEKMRAEAIKQHNYEVFGTKLSQRVQNQSVDFISGMYNHTEVVEIFYHLAYKALYDTKFFTMFFTDRAHKTLAHTTSLISKNMELFSKEMSIDFLEADRDAYINTLMFVQNQMILKSKLLHAASGNLGSNTPQSNCIGRSRGRQIAQLLG